jgi:DNA polymerase-3 subunit gamma/tau
MGGQPREAIATLEALHNDGADAMQIVSDLAEAVHAATRIKAAGEDAVPALSAGERARANAAAGRLPMAALARAWQMLLKGLEEVGRAPRAITAAEMLLIRMCYASNLPAPDEVIRSLTANPAARTNSEPSRNESPTRADVRDSSDAPRGRRIAGGEDAPLLDDEKMPDPGPEMAAPLPPRLESYAGVVALAGEKRDVRLKMALEDQTELVRFKPGHIELHLLAGAPKDLAGELGRRLLGWTAERWIISITAERGERPLGEVRREREAKMLEEARRHPSVQQVMRTFPGAAITAVRDLGDGEKGEKG